MDKEDFECFFLMLFMYIYLSIYLSFDVLGWVGRLVGDDRVMFLVVLCTSALIIKAILDNNKICIAFNPFLKHYYMDD
jgi:hypothetical protein